MDRLIIDGMEIFPDFTTDLYVMDLGTGEDYLLPLSARDEYELSRLRACDIDAWRDWIWRVIVYGRRL